MVRHYVRKTDRQTWNEESMVLAIKAVIKDGMSYVKASTTYGVPHSTLQDRVKKINDGKIDINIGALKGLGHYKRVFNFEQEKELSEYLKEMESRLFGLSQQNFRKLAFELAERNGIEHSFNRSSGMAGKDWLYGFLKRHPDLSVRAPEPTSAARAMGFNQPVVKQFFDLLKQCYETYKFPADRIFNVDESGLSNVAKSRAKIIAHKGRKQVGKLSSAERGQNVTVTICMSASGNFIPPLMIFPRVRMNPDLIDGAPPATIVVCHPSGWMQSHIFVQWLEHFIKHTNPTKSNPVLLLLDGHVTHVKNLDVIDLARKNHIVILCFPPHTTHRLQPLDVSFMGPLSTFYSQQLDYWLVNHPGRIVGLHQISSIFGEAYIKAANIKNACSGFKNTGIFPFNPEVFTEADFAASKTTNINQIQEHTEQVNNKISSTAPQTEIITPNDTIETEVSTTSINVPLVINVSQEKCIITQNTSIFKVSPEIIQPIPKIHSRSSRSNNTKRGKTAIITESPYKNELVASQNIKPVKRNIFADKSVSSNKKAMKKCATNSNVDVTCLYCNELYTTNTKGEKWIKCTTCKNWLHELCGSGENWKTYVCDICAN